MKFKNFPKRVRGIQRYLSLAHSYKDYFGLTALGIARGHSFATDDLVGWMGRSICPTLRVRMKTFGGAYVSLDLQDVSHMIILDEFALEHVYDVQLPFKPDGIFDCGGHIGLFSLLMAHKYPGAPIVTFEPNPRNVVWLKRNIALNKLNIELIQAAVSIAEGTEWFDGGSSHSGSLLSAPSVGFGASVSTATTATAAPTANPRYEVRVVDFPRFFKTRNPSSALLKIDIEGEEMRLIPSLLDLLPFECAVFFETHAGPPAWNSISKLFTDAGFVVTKRSEWEYLNMGLALRATA
jgi:FkbM family methyltransferase